MNDKTPKTIFPEIIFMRALCALLIIVYHYSCYCHCAISSFHYNSNGQWGSPIVTVFFMISGAMLYHNHPQVRSLKRYYYRRWKSVYPAFYLIFSFLFFLNVLKYKDLFYGPEPWTLIYTVLGIDGYVLHPNYYIIGEWFLGAIIILYLLYPLIAWGIRRSPRITAGIVLLLYVVCILTNFSPMYKFRQIPVCLLSFYMGMVMISHRDLVLNSKAILAAAAAVAAILICVKLPFPDILVNCEFPATLLGVCLFIVFFHLGKLAMSVSWLRRVITEIGSLSYYIFLLQHVLISEITQYQNPYSLAGGILILVIIILLSVIFAKAAQILTNAILTSEPYLKMEQKILRES